MGLVLYRFSFILISFFNWFAASALKPLLSLLERLTTTLEWYSHTTDIKTYYNPNHESAVLSLIQQDDDEESLDDYDIYFNEYDWETEKLER